MSSPATVNAISARNSAVRSTTIERVATDQEMPCSVAARTPSTKPPTTENGRQLPAESRTSRPQTNGMRWRALFNGATTRQPIPRTTIVRSCQTQNNAKPSLPTESVTRSEEHTSELQSPDHLVCRLLLEKKKKRKNTNIMPIVTAIKIGSKCIKINTNSNYTPQVSSQNKTTESPAYGNPRPGRHNGNVIW